MNKTELIESINETKKDIAEFSKALKLARKYKKMHQVQLNNIIEKEAEEAESERNLAIVQECFDKEFKQ